ncbi:Gfo/Idh/MocA family protein [Lignipirellula cremea]|uniref:Inositol 2-dehydrogenase n=1 Tax=Lignipirellula cremea TaxID=2528010 RepID=A0A518DPY4_9BACT|nr:Gfo/Idh/MocA family oxidoreductase [Lignipirellula cremea]QDU93902.1 Inositol 2-dehydrogenase [Lignipirellula cremea]
MILKPDRRRFLQAAAAAGAASSIVPAVSRGEEKREAPSRRLTLGCIGVGGKGRNNLGRFLTEKDVQVVAVCDVDENHTRLAADMVREKYGNDDCRVYADFRELLARDDIDAVSIATPDHWHALTAIAAAEAGKHIYCEKPLANSVGEGRAICNAVEQNKVLLQTGSHERSNPNARFAAELVRNGRIGKLREIVIHLPCDQAHHQQVKEFSSKPAASSVPEGFDYDFWLGHTAEAPYSEKRCHFWWRFILAYGGGEMTDRGAHIIDLAQLGAGTDATGPVLIEAKGVQNPDSLYDAYMDYQFVNTYGNGVRMTGKSEGPRGLKFIGDEGWIFVHVHGCKLEAEPASLLQTTFGENDVQLGRSPGHHRNFLDAVLHGAELMAPAEVGHRTATICHLNNIAMQVGRSLKWNPETEQIEGDEEASALLTPAMRSPWKL